MSDGVLTKEQLDAVTAAWRRWRDEMGVPVTQKAMPSEPVVISARDRALAKGLAEGFAETIRSLELQIERLEQRLVEAERKIFAAVLESTPPTPSPRGDTATASPRSESGVARPRGH